MNLLPKSKEDFATTEYWNSFFDKRADKSFDWYGEYFELACIVHKYIKAADNILMVGCGNSKMSMDMFDNGFRKITNIDISHVAIKRMLDLNANTRNEMKFVQMDATAMSFPDETFSVAFDKGTLDAICVDKSDEVHARVESYFKEILRVMRNGGRYLCISLLQDPILNYLLEFFTKNSCMVRVIYFMDVERGKQDSTERKDCLTLPIFAVVVTKFKALKTPILEFCLNVDRNQRMQTNDDITQAVSSIQKASLVCNGLYHGSIAGHNEVTMDLCSLTDQSVRYTLYILDQPPARGLKKFAVFIVPQGREVEWLFSTPKGRKKLVGSVNFKRLAIVIMHRDQQYESLETVKDELSLCVRSIGPNGLTEDIPFLSLGSDVGKRETLVSGCSKISGDFRIEEVEGNDGKVYRRLIFLNNQFVVQSEALVKTIKSKKAKKERKKIDIGYLACQHHLFMSVGVQMATKAHNQAENVEKDVVIIGLGGGGLCTFLHAALTQIRITAVEIDPLMLEVAEQYFELKQDKRLHVVIDDGIAFLYKCKKENMHFNAVLFDVDSKDLTLGMSCPPKNFLDSQVIADVKEIIGAKGIFILNLVCRDETLREEAIADLKKFFTSVCCYKLEEDVNEVIFCSNNEKYKNLVDWQKVLGAAGRNLNSNIIQKQLSNEELVNVTDFLNELKI